ncbi:recombinase family protein [Nocardia sp. CDC159]|uniref:Recombinase family protein n=1 Tax=Nocardia pulmonis TaxID=2951408 RepID=A0A9X2EB73_9NOCA|nr:MULTISPECIES: recombinase family protein [Nocardia]MCM6774928.1 recombinase family protein [Nocardia pulmonis]MCM6789859.1 recombinase family protein [Nocardia sp. CDC159]
MTENTRAARRERLDIAAQLRWVIYARKSGPGDKSPADQEKAGRRDIESIGGVVVEVFKDNLSASRYRRVQERKGFVAMRKFIQAGHADGLWTFAHNRGHRDLDDYVHLRRMCIESRIPWRYSGRTYELWRAVDRRAANADAVRAEEQSDDISEAVKRGIDEAVTAGEPHGKVLKGYRIVRDPNSGKPIRREPIPEQAAVIREAARRVLPPRLEKLQRVSRDLTPAWEKAGGKGAFDLKALRKILTNPSYAGLRTHKGQVVRVGTWEGILTVDEHERLVALLDDPSRRTHRGNEPVHLVSYIATCTQCKEVVHGRTPTRSRRGYPFYTCEAGCVGRGIAKVDAHVEEVLLRLLEHPDTMAKLMAEDAEGKASVDEQLAHIERLRNNIRVFVKQAARTGLTAAEVDEYVSEVKTQIREAEERMKASIGDPVLAGIVGPDVRRAWAGYDMVQKRDVIRRAMKIEIRPVEHRGRYSEVGVEIYPLRGLAAVPMEIN